MWSIPEMEKMSVQDRLAYEEELLKIMHVKFEQNSEENEQQYFL